MTYFLGELGDFARNIPAILADLIRCEFFVSRRTLNGKKMIAGYVKSVKCRTGTDVCGERSQGEETGAIKKALPPNRLVNVPLSPGGSGIFTTTSLVPPYEDR
jgi:hypothetical protein